jgi:predicted RNase H-like HicB family nuclease
MKLSYAVVFERLPNNYGAYVPDLPGCISTGDTWDEMQQMIREAIVFHIEGIMEDGEPVPVPRMSAEEAMVCHNDLLAEEGVTGPSPESIVDMVEVEIAAKSPGTVTV